MQITYGKIPAAVHGNSAHDVNHHSFQLEPDESIIKVGMDVFETVQNTRGNHLNGYLTNIKFYTSLYRTFGPYGRHNGLKMVHPMQNLEASGNRLLWVSGREHAKVPYLTDVTFTFEECQ